MNRSTRTGLSTRWIFLWLLCLHGPVARGGHPASPAWWITNRAIYAAHALSGAGGPLMKFPGQDIRTLGTFENLPIMLKDARRLGCNCLYLVDYWEGGYENKGDYVPRSDLGGSEALRKGVAAVHAQGGKVLLYLEAFIVHRNSQVGQQHGRAWAMLDQDGTPYTYYGRDRFFLMYPGQGSGWTEHLCGRAEQLTRDCGVDGFHLDSYGLQWDWKDYHPQHPSAADPHRFNQGAIHLVQTLRDRVRSLNPDAVVILEGCERAELLDVCDGGQLDSAAWQYSPMNVLREKPWFLEKPYRAFTSHFSLEEMRRILESGYNLSLTPWWFEEFPGEKDFQRMRQPLKDKDDWYRRMLTLWHWDNLLYANGQERPEGIDLFRLRRDLERQRYLKREGPYGTTAYEQVVAAYEPRVRRLLQTGQPVRTEEACLKEMLQEFQGLTQIPPDRGPGVSVLNCSVFKDQNLNNLTH